MNKRQAKKSRTAYKKRVAKIKAIVTADLTDVTDGSQIDLYVSNKFESNDMDKGFSCIRNEFQNRYISSKKFESKGFTHAVHIKNGGNKHFGVTLWVSDTDKSYYVIRPHREPEKGHSETTLEGEEVAL